MEVTVVAKHGEIPADIQSTIEQKVRKLPRFFDRATSIRVVLDLSREAHPQAEIIVSAEEANDFFATDSGNNVLGAVEKVIEKIEKQLRRHKEKITGHRGRGDKRHGEVPDLEE